MITYILDMIYTDHSYMMVTVGDDMSLYSPLQPHINGLKLAMAGMFTAQKWANAINQVVIHSLIVS